MEGNGRGHSGHARFLFFSAVDRRLRAASMTGAAGEAALHVTILEKKVVPALRRGIMKPHEQSASRNNSRSGDPIGISIPQEVPT